MSAFTTAGGRIRALTAVHRIKLTSTFPPLRTAAQAPADAPLIEADILFNQSGPAQMVSSTKPPGQSFVAPSFWRAGAEALFGRVLLIASGVASSIVLPLALDQTTVGQFFFAQIVIAGISTFGQLGLAFSIPAVVTRAASLGDFGRARQSATWMLTLSSFAGLLGGGIAWMVLPHLHPSLDADNMSPWLAAIPVIAAIIPLTTLSAVLVELLRAVHQIRAAANLATLASISTVAYLAFVLFVGTHASLVGVLLAGLGGGCPRSNDRRIPIL